TEGKDGLKGAVATLLGGSTCRITLDQKQLTLFGLLTLAICQLSGQTAERHGALADDLSGLLGGFTCACGQDCSLDNCLGLLWVFFEVDLKQLANRTVHHGFDFAVQQLVFSLIRKLRRRGL